MSRAILGAVAAIGFGLVASVPASAQVLNIPQRAAETTAPRSDVLETRGLFSVDVLGGYDDSSAQDASTGGGVGAPPLQTAPGSVGLADLALVYGRSRGSRQFSIDARTGVTGYSGIGLGPSQRASFGVTAATPLGRSVTLRVGNQVSYDSLYAADAFGPIAGEVPVNELPTSTALSAVLRRRSWASATSLGLDRTFGRRVTTSLQYAFDYRDFLDEADPSSHTHGVRTSYDHKFGRSGSLNAEYSYSQGEFVGGVQVLDQRPLSTHSVEVGPQFSRRISPRRSLIVGFGAGATRVSTVTGPLQEIAEFWTPFGHATVRVDLARSWALTGNFRRTASVLDGLTPETYVSDTFGAAVGGNVGSRVQVTFSGGAANGRLGATSTVTSEYTSYVGSAQASVNLTRTISALVNYSRYQYAFGGDPIISNGVPQQFSRNAIRVGLSYAMPLTRQPRAARP